MIARMTSTNQLMATYMELGNSRVKFAERLAALRAWVEIIGTIMALDTVLNEDFYPSMIGRRHFLAGRDCLDEPGQWNFEVREGRSPESLVLVFGFEAICLIVCAAQHSYLQYPIAEKKKHAELLCVEKAAIPAYSVLDGRGYRNHGGCDWRDSLSLRYNAYLIPLS